ncbi:ROK family transcriptional regulator [Kribbella shirazensis]|uniref:Putative NBD/HSP70 family sugar kinase n=1 Tax=Kribbella shirazensis TaxID=1105143 RepID=A0A7X6A203_9ACTN|nr:ROK family transcriptional regulator [Kribbella shirazensis]NIK58776.1 putative NBD/HSP70 family sugar kinase [Kribbella shirazensis]
MARRGTNLDRVGGFNDAVVLDAIRRSEQLSRVELAEVTGLSGQAISNIARRLLDAGLVREAGRLRGAGLGKPRTLLELEPTGRYSVGVHLDPSVVTVVLLDLTGEMVARRPVDQYADDPDLLIDGIAKTIEEVIAESGALRERVTGVGIAAPGPIDVERGVVVDPPNLSTWHLVPLRDALGERTGLPVVLDKDVTAAASAEKWAGRGGSFLFFYLGTGVGAGLVVGDEVIRGSSSNVGEIGHVIVDPDGPVCYCGRRGCVGESSQPRYLVQEAVAAGVLAAGIDLDDRPAVDEAFARLCALAAEGTSAAREIVVRLAGRIAKVVEDIANLLDLDRVVFGGPHWEPLAPVLGDAVRDALEGRFLLRAVHPFEVTGTALGTDVGAIGAASLVLDRTFSPNPSVVGER